MVAAFSVADMDCIRYKGTDRVIQLRLVQIGEERQCDQLLPSLQSGPRIPGVRSRPQQAHQAPSPLQSLLFRLKRWFGRNA
jgi:hypothetical protein